VCGRFDQINEKVELKGQRLRSGSHTSDGILCVRKEIFKFVYGLARPICYLRIFMDKRYCLPHCRYNEGSESISIFVAVLVI
jgi:hypothetical protein